MPSNYNNDCLPYENIIESDKGVTKCYQMFPSLALIVKGYMYVSVLIPLKSFLSKIS